MMLHYLLQQLWNTYCVAQECDSEAVFWLANPNYSILIFQGFCLWLCFRIYGLEQPAVLYRFQITLVCYS